VRRTRPVQQAEIGLVADLGLAPETGQNRPGKGQGRHLVGARPEQGDQGRERLIPAGAIADFRLNQDRQLARLVARQSADSRLQLRQTVIGAGLDDRLQGGAMGGGQGSQDGSLGKI